MTEFKPKSKHGPEYAIQAKWVKFLKAKGWHVERLVGNAFQKGIPDIFIIHPEHGLRFIDIKVYKRYHLTKAQRAKWPIWEKFGMGIWILGADSKEACTKEHMINEYEKLFNKPNWRDFWKESYNINIDEIIGEI